MRKEKIRSAGYIALLILAGISCRLTSPTPAAWSGTPTEDVLTGTNAGLALTSRPTFDQTEERILTPWPTSTEESDVLQNTPTPIDEGSGPWLIYPAPSSEGIHAYHLGLDTIVEIDLPAPVYWGILNQGFSPDERTLVIRAGSIQNLDELALYQIDLPAFEIKKISPLLSVSLQRKIVNDESARALETLDVITQPGGLAWSPDGRYLAFTAALNNESSDLYVFDHLNDRIDRVNGLFTQNATPFWAPGSNWLVSQEYDRTVSGESWRSVNVTGLRTPGFDSQNTLYLPASASQSEEFVGWINSQNFFSYSLTPDGPAMLRQINIERFRESVIFTGPFDQAAFDPNTSSLAFSVNTEQASSQGMVAGIYLLRPDHANYSLYRAGDWKRLSWDPGGMFIAESTQGVLVFNAEGEDIFLLGESNARLSPHGNWMIAWGTGDDSTAGARLYQPPSSRALQTLVDVPINAALWQPDSKGFFLYGDGHLYHLIFPGLNPKEIAGEFLEEGTLEMIWVEGD